MASDTQKLTDGALLFLTFKEIQSLILALYKFVYMLT